MARATASAIWPATWAPTSRRALLRRRRAVIAALPCRPDHAAHRQAVLRAHDQLRAAGLGVRPGRGLPLPGRRIPAPAGPGRPCRSCCWSCGATLPATRLPPEACLVNYYAAGAKMGSHRDAGRGGYGARRWCRSRSATMPSSTSADCARSDPKQRLVLQVGRRGGAGRRRAHGLPRHRPHPCRARPICCAEGGRFNLTLRRVTPAATEPPLPRCEARSLSCR